MKKFLSLLISVIMVIQAWSQSANLNINNIDAGVTLYGGLFFNGVGSPLFEVPTGSNKHTIFASSFFIGGLDDQDSPHYAELLHPLSSSVPGPVSNQGQCDEANYNHIWKISRAQIDSFLTWQSNPGTYPNYQFPSDLISFPAQGNEQAGFASDFFPFIDVNNDGEYNAVNGDYPDIRGDQALCFIINDACGEGQVEALPLGIELRVMVYAFDCPGDSALNETIFLHADIVNRSQNTYHNVWLASYTDFDIGFNQDDYAGCDVERSAFYAYNALEHDGGQPSVNYYYEHPPAQSVVILGGPYQDADQTDNAVGIQPGQSINGTGYGDGIVDNERLGLSRFYSPSNVASYYSMQGLKPDGSPVYYYSTDSIIPVNLMFPDSSDQQYYYSTNGIPVEPWTEYTWGNIPEDRRGLGSTGPFTLAPGQSQPLDLAFVFGRDYNGNHLTSIDVMQERIDAVREMFLKDSIPSPCGGSFTTVPVSVEEQEEKLKFHLFPNPVVDAITVQLHSNGRHDFNYQLYNLTGKVVKQGQLTHSETRIDLSGLSSGIYAVGVYSEKERVVRKFVKK